MSSHEDREMRAVRDALYQHVGKGPEAQGVVVFRPAPPVNFPNIAREERALLHKALSEGVTDVPEMDLSNPALQVQSLDEYLWPEQQDDYTDEDLKMFENLKKERAAPDINTEHFRKTVALLTNAGFTVEHANLYHPHSQARLELEPMPVAHVQFSMNRLHLLLLSTLGEPPDESWGWDVHCVLRPFEPTATIVVLNVQDSTLMKGDVG